MANQFEINGTRRIMWIGLIFLMLLQFEGKILGTPYGLGNFIREKKSGFNGYKTSLQKNQILSGKEQKGTYQVHQTGQKFGNTQQL